MSSCKLRGTLINAKNLLSNGSSEVTAVTDIPDCWDQYLGPKKVKNWYSLWKIDNNIAFDGKKFLCIMVSSYNLRWKLDAESCYRSSLIRLCKLDRLEDNQYNTLSLYLKSKRLKFPAMVIIKTDKSYKFNVNVPITWKRYSFTFYLNYGQLKEIRIVPLGIEKLWIDAVQLEKGKEATKFTPFPYNIYFINLPNPKKVNEIKKELIKLGWEENLNFSKLKFYSSKKIDIDPIKRSILVNGKPFFFFAVCFMTAHLYKNKWQNLLCSLKKQEYTCIITSFSCNWNASHVSNRKKSFWILHINMV